MIRAARERLREAAVAGVRQIHGGRLDGHGGRCAMGVLVEPHPLLKSRPLGQIIGPRSIVGDWAVCPMCAVMGDEEFLVIHLNDEHRLDFLGIAEKMPVSRGPNGEEL
jgi:hypothetical protein